MADDTRLETVRRGASLKPGSSSDHTEEHESAKRDARPPLLWWLQLDLPFDPALLWVCLRAFDSPQIAFGHSCTRGWRVRGKIWMPAGHACDRAGLGAIVVPCLSRRREVLVFVCPPSLIAGGNQDLMLSADNVCGPMEAWKNRPNLAACSHVAR